MIKHPINPSETAIKKPDQTEDVALGSGSPLLTKSRTSDQIVTEADLKELIEKNLKWSQIIYEQNRKINNKLLWAAVASWIRVLLILIPLVLGLLFLPSLLKGVWSQYGELLGGSGNATTSPRSFDSVLKLLNLDPAKEQQLKALIK